MFYLIELTALILHITKYKEYFGNIAMNFAVTFALNKIMKSINDKEKADMINLAGYTLTFSSFIEYLAAVKNTPTGEDTTGAIKIWHLAPMIKEAILEMKNMKE